jgi:outer membrane protein TolC
MKKQILILCLAASLSFFSTAQTGARTITIDDAVNLALQNNLEIKQSKMDLDLLAKKNQYSWNSVSPSISASGGFNGNTPLGDGDTSFSYSLGASLNLTLTPALRTTMKKALLDYQSGQASLETTKRKIELSVRKTFYSLIYFNDNLEIQQRSLETAKQTYEANQVKYKQGRLAELQLLNSQYNYEKKIPDVENLKRNYQSNIDSFKLLLGLALEDEITLEGKLDEAVSVHFDETILQASLNSIEENAQIKALKQQIISTENTIQATKLSSYAPTVSFSVSENTNGSSKENPMAGKDAWEPSSSLSYGVTVRVPLDGYFPWSSGKLNVASSEEALQKLKMNLEQTRTQTTLAVKNSYNSILQALTQLELLEKNVELTQKTYDMSKNAYNMGSVDLLSLQQAEDNLYSARYNVQNQKYTILTSILTLEDTLGLPYGTLGK